MSEGPHKIFNIEWCLRKEGPHKVFYRIMSKKSTRVNAGASKVEMQLDPIFWTGVGSIKNI